MKKIFFISLISITLSLAVISVYAWFVEGSVSDVKIIAGSTDVSFDLYEIVDHNYDGLYDGDYNLPPFSHITTTYQTDTSKYTGFIDERSVCLYKNDSNYILEESNNLITLIPKKIEDFEVDILSINNFYPSRVNSFAIAIRGSSRNIGCINLTFENLYIPNSFKEVVSINIGNSKKLFYDYNTIDNEVIKLLEEPIEIKGNEVVWVFFSIEFETLDSIKTLYNNQNEYFNSLTSLNNYQVNNYSLPLITIVYELHEIIKKQ